MTQNIGSLIYVTFMACFSDISEECGGVETFSWSTSHSVIIISAMKFCLLQCHYLRESPNTVWYYVIKVFLKLIQSRKYIIAPRDEHMCRGYIELHSLTISL